MRHTTLSYTAAFATEGGGGSHKQRLLLRNAFCLALNTASAAAALSALLWTTG
ncbi:MAG: hypothetical protein LBG05_08210 [Treponema sp.]|nr:hypothetical protein [Treponema sp.]